MNDPQNNRSQSDATQTPIDTVALSSSPSSQSTSQNDGVHVQRADAIAHMAFGLGGRRGSNNSTVSEEGNRGTLRRSR